MNLVSPQTRREFVRFTKFTVVGTIGAVVDFGTFNLLAGGLGLPNVPSSIASFLAAVASNFLWNRYWTYPDSRSKQVRDQAVQFVAVNVVGLAIRTPIFIFAQAPASRLAEQLLMRLQPFMAVSRPLPLDPSSLGRNLALALAVAVVLVWNFGVNRYWTYSDVE